MYLLYKQYMKENKPSNNISLFQIQIFIPNLIKIIIPKIYNYIMGQKKLN